jgi:hypothetical protein
MIAIDTRLVPLEGKKKEAMQSWRDLFLADSPPADFLAFCKECVDQNLILPIGSKLYDFEDQLLVVNKFNDWVNKETGMYPGDAFEDSHESWKHIIRYYAVDLPKAEIFIQKLEDMSADFSVKKFWLQNNWHFYTNYSTVDFDQEITSFTFVDHSSLWDISWPSPIVAYHFDQSNLGE